MAGGDPESPVPSDRQEVPSELDHGILALSTRRPVAMIMVVCTVVVFGVISFYQLPQNLMPDISYPTITVRTEFPGAAPIDVEDRISERLESVLSQVRNLRRISSVSRAEISEIILEFVWGTDMGQSALEVREKVDQAILPDEVEKPTILRYDPTLDPILQLGFYRARAAGASPPATGDQIEQLIDLRIEAEEGIEKDLELVPGVAAVEVRGGYEKEIRIDVDETLLPPKEIDMELISRRLEEENQNLASGILYEGEQAFIVRAVNEFQNLEEIRRIVLRQQGEVPVRLEDVARVYHGYRDPEVLTRFNGSPCVKIDLYKEADANVVEVARRVLDRLYGTTDEERIEELQERGSAALRLSPDPARSTGPDRPRTVLARLDDDERVVVMSNQARFIEKSLYEVRSTAILGGLLAIGVLYLFLRNLWFTTMVGFAIPLSVIATFTVMKILDVSLNIMSLGGLALGVGMLVDNSIVVLESIFRCREAGDSPRLAAVRGGRAVAGAVTASTLTTVAVFFPIVFVEGMAGQIFRDQALTVVIALLASLAVSLTFIPSLVSRQFSGISTPDGGWVEPPGEPLLSREFLRNRLRGPLASMRWSRRTVILLGLAAPVIVTLSLVGIVFEALGRLARWALAACALLARSLFGWLGRLGGRANRGMLDGFARLWEAVEDFYPRLIRSALAHRGLVIVLALGAALASGLLFTRLGSELIPEVHQGEFTAEMALAVGTRIEKTDRVVKEIEDDVLSIPGVLSVATTVGVEKDSARAGEEGEHSARLLVRVEKQRDPAAVEERVKQELRQILRRTPEIATDRMRNPVLFSFKTPIEVEIKGYNLRRLKEVASEVTARMREIPSIKDVKSSMQPGYPEIHLKFRRDLLIRHDLDVGVIGNAIRRKVEGEVPTRFSEGDRKVDLRVRLQERDRASLEDLRELIVNPGRADKLPLSYVAEIIEGEGPAEIRRIGQTRAAVVGANLAGLDLGRATESISATLRDMKIPPDFSVGFGGQQMELEASRHSLLRALILAVFLVYVVMAAQFESLVQPLVIIFSIPLAAVGIAPVLYLLDEPLSVIAFIGMIILAGIVVNNAIVLIDCINQFRREGVEKYEAIARAGRIRLRPIFMSTGTTVLGLLPLTGVLNFLPVVGPLFAALLGVGEGLEIRAPMAITVIAGLLSSSLLTLVVIPVVYSFADRRS